MKIYQYEPETGVYAGELFEENVNIQYYEGVTEIPPPKYVEGEVPVFDRKTKQWEILPITTVWQLLQLKPEGIQNELL
jgi:hypothetical protein